MCPCTTQSDCRRVSFNPADPADAHLVECRRVVFSIYTLTPEGVHVTTGIVHCLQASPPEGLFKPGGRGAVAQMLKRKQELQQQRQQQQRQQAQQEPQPQSAPPLQGQKTPVAEATRLRGLLQQELGLQVLSSALP